VVANEYSGTVSRIDPSRNAVVATVAIGGQPTSLTVAGARLWAGADANGDSHRGGTLVLASVLRFPSVDPALYDNAGPAQFGGLAYDTLVTFDHTGGVDGLRLVPDLAVALPTPTDGGRTYTFRLRPGIRYSNGAALRAEDFAARSSGCSESVRPAPPSTQRSKVPLPARDGPRAATSRAGSSPTTPPAPSSFTSRPPTPSSSRSSLNRILRPPWQPARQTRTWG
jgi:YVTN family beta-propeller protein